MTESILNRVKSGAVRVFGKVGESDPPWLVLPLTVEPKKPRLCLDARFANLWMKDSPFTLDKLSDVPRYVFKDSYMTKCDDKSDYDHVLLQEKSQQYFGFECNGWWFVCATLPFGWKESPFIYHNIGLAASSYFRSIGIPCSLYIDDRLNGELLTPSGPWSTPYSDRSDSYRHDAAAMAIKIVSIVLVRLGYTIGLSKSVLKPTHRLEFLGFIVDSVNQTFVIPQRKITTFAALREQILLCKKSVNVKRLQKLQGKCVSFSLALPVIKLYIRAISRAIATASDTGLVKFTADVREEVEYWRFLDSWSSFTPWRKEKHVRLSLSTDASGTGWGCVVHDAAGDTEFGDYWSDLEMSLHISTKEMLAICHALESSLPNAKDCRVDIQVDSQVVIDTFRGEGSKKSKQLTEATKRVYECVKLRNIQLELSHVPSKQNRADAPSRRLSVLDSTLSSRSWDYVQEMFGGSSGHTIDLMALDSNAQLDYEGQPLPHFTHGPSAHSLGVNMFAQNLNVLGDLARNPYVFPPFCLIGPVLSFLKEFRIPFTIIVPDLFPRPFWWPILMGLSSCALKICPKGDGDAILSLSKSGYVPRPSPFPLLACRISRF